MAIRVLGGLGSAGGGFLFYQSTRKFKSLPNDPDSFMDFHAGVVLLGVTCLAVFALAAVGTIAACRSVLQEVRDRRIAIQSERDFVSIVDVDAH